MAYLVEALQECSAAAVQAGVRYALEPLNRYETTLIHTVADGLTLIEEVGAANFGLLLDTFHMNIEEPSIEESIRQAGESHLPLSRGRLEPLASRRGPSGLRVDPRGAFGMGYAGFVSGGFLPIPDAETAGAARDRVSQESRGRLRHGGVQLAAPWPSGRVG